MAITLPSIMASYTEGNGEEWGVWEEVGDGEKEGGQQEEEAAQEHFDNGSKAFNDGHYDSAVDFLRQSLEISPRNIQICFPFEFPKSGDAKAISLFRSRIQNLERTNVAFLADNGDDASVTEVGLEGSSLAKDIQFFTNILLSVLEEKLEDLEQT
ncbi:hypothetical protein QYE76_041910 [Lolium multiflorum]|uniref:Uncharacterized protein n=1 Tax=Lolium multiflorum TaxID=4521 RepID=A0AAD8WU67_LOLMU|nr:hypothetical protein QYE76_041910 [Lolium multiflorum]